MTKKYCLIFIALLMLAGMLAGCGQNDAASDIGPPLLTVSGKIGAANSGDKFVLDQAFFDASSVELQMDDPWMGDGIRYKGVLVRDLLAKMEVPAEATTIRVVATDGKGLDIAIADAQNWDIMLAHWADGEELINDNGGPVKIAFPAEARSTYADEEWMWWLTTADVK